MIVSTIGSEKSSSSGPCNYRDYKNKQRSNNYADQKAAAAKALAKQQQARLHANMLAASQMALNTIDNSNVIGDGDQQTQVARSGLAPGDDGGEIVVDLDLHGVHPRFIRTDLL